MDRIREVAIIGAGASGLISAKELLGVGLQVTVFEKQPCIGGVWNNQAGSAMYESLRTNLPKEIMAFNADHPFPPSTHSFLSCHEVRAYLDHFASQYQLDRYIQLNTEVLAVEKDGYQWRISTQCLQSQMLRVQNFDAVLVCNGHFEVPLVPRCEGFPANFNSREHYHSIQYQQIKHTLLHKTILVVGTKSSGTDLARELSSAGNRVLVSDRHLHRDSPAAKHCDIEYYPQISRFLPECAIEFSNGDVVGDVDVVIWCTGYQYSLSFLQSAEAYLKVRVHQAKQVQGLYQQLFAIEDNSICFVGLPFMVVPFPLFWLQARWIASVFVGKSALPAKEEQEAWLEQYEVSLKQIGLGIDKYHFLGGQLQWDYCKAVANCIDPSDTATQSYLRVIQSIYDDCTRRRPYYTGAPDDYRNVVYNNIDFSSEAWSVQESTPSQTHSRT